MNVQELRPFECIRLTEGTGDSTMCIIKGNVRNRIYVTQENTRKGVYEIKDADETSKATEWFYKHFSKSEGEKYDTRQAIANISKNSRDWYTLLLCEEIQRGLEGRE